MYWVRDLHIGIVDFELDSKTVVDSLYGSKSGVSNFSAVINDCRRMLASDLVTSDVSSIPSCSSLPGSKTMAPREASSKFNVSKIEAAVKNPRKRKRTKFSTATPTRSYLPEELWEYIFKFLNHEDSNTFSLLLPGLSPSFQNSFCPSPTFFDSWSKSPRQQL
ncbi:hypothetical protein MTR_4g010930 [Medicago truncatula]|uniref:F-box domain-containing protein n=1 Tax=Medicago truncatula TaxID=3880 RepID=A0A072UG14_MEDTR|nr:hypothetical protein MTR_4g010930 [Medicago truncatula]